MLSYGTVFRIVIHFFQEHISISCVLVTLEKKMIKFQLDLNFLW